MSRGRFFCSCNCILPLGVFVLAAFIGLLLILALLYAFDESPPVGFAILVLLTVLLLMVFVFRVTINGMERLSMAIFLNKFMFDVFLISLAFVGALLDDVIEDNAETSFGFGARFCKVEVV